MPNYFFTSFYARDKKKSEKFVIFQKILGCGTNSTIYWEIFTFKTELNEKDEISAALLSFDTITAGKSEKNSSMKMIRGISVSLLPAVRIKLIANK